MDDRSISRVTRTKAQARETYDRLSGWYDLLAVIAEKRCKEAGLQLLDVRQGEVVLEMGHGTGQCIIPLARFAGTMGRVFGIDLSPGMCRVAWTRAKKAGVLERVALMVGDAAMLPYAANSMDAVFTSFTLELFDTPEIPMVLNQCWRVLSPGGRLCVVAMAKREKKNLMLRLYEWVHRNFQQWVDCRPIHARDALEEGGFIIDTLNEMSIFGLPVDVILSKKP